MKYLIVLLLASCGKPVALQCTWSVENSVLLTLGTLEKAKCPNDDFIISYTPEYKAGGEIIDIKVQCGRRVQTCKTVNQ